MEFLMAWVMVGAVVLLFVVPYRKHPLRPDAVGGSERPLHLMTEAGVEVKPMAAWRMVAGGAGEGRSESGVPAWFLPWGGQGVLIDEACLAGLEESVLQTLGCPPESELDREQRDRALGELWASLEPLESELQWVQPLLLKAGTALVLRPSVLSCLVQVGSDELYVLNSEEALETHEVPECIQKVSPLIPMGRKLLHRHPGGRLFLMDACDSHATVTAMPHVVVLPQGRYQISTYVIPWGNRNVGILHWRLVHPS